MKKNYFAILKSDILDKADEYCTDSNFSGNLYMSGTDVLYHFVLRDEEMPVHIFKQGRGKNCTTIITDSELDKNNFHNSNRIEFGNNKGKGSYAKLYVKGYDEPVAFLCSMSNSAESLDWIRLSSNLNSRRRKNTKYTNTKRRNIR